MQMINTATVEPLVFLDSRPEEDNKILWKRAYATYLRVTGKMPEENANKSINLPALLPILAEFDQRWRAVDEDMMKTSHRLVHRLNIFLKRFKGKPWEVKVVLQEMRDHQDASAEVDQTVNPDRTDSEKSDEDQQKVEPSELGLKNERCSEQDQEEEAKAD